MKKLFIAFSLSLFILLPVCSFSQPPCMPNDQGSYSEHQWLSSYPPLSTDMPLDVLIGYIACDSAARNVNLVDAQDFVLRQSWNDTLRYILRFYYQMKDFNCFKFLQFLKYSPASYGALPDAFEINILRIVNKVSPKPFLHSLLLRSSIITHILVIDTLRTKRDDGGICKNLNTVTCSVVEMLKGKVIPECSFYSNIQKENEKYQKSINGVCLKFDYCCEWTKGRYGEPLCDSTGTGDIKINNEYLVFLNTRIICADSANIYMNFMPAGHNSKCFSMYPIIDGYVKDLNNELGYGISISVSDFYELLNSEISEIINYGN